VDHVTSVRPQITKLGVVAVPTDEESYSEPEMTCRWWRPLSLQEKMSGFARNRYVISDHTQSDEFHCLGEASPLRLFLVHGLVTTLLAVGIIGIGWF
jgi:hypothetical protein